MLHLVKKLLSQVIDDIDTGNCNASEEEMMELYNLIMKFKQDSEYLTKEESARYLHISRATFDRKIKQGEIPEGKSRAGLKEKFWSKATLNRYRK